VILIIAGFILASVRNEPQTKIKGDLVKKTLNQWSVSADLEQNDKMVVEIRYGADWPRGYFEPYEENPDIGLLFVLVNVEEPSGNTTQFDVVYAQSSDVTVALWNISVVKQGGINTTALYDQYRNTYTAVGGIVPQNGTYTVEVDKEGMWPSRFDPPAYLGIFKGVIEIEYPYAFLLPTGIVVGIVGTATSIYGWRSTRVHRPPKRKKTPPLSSRRSTRHR